MDGHGFGFHGKSKSVTVFDMKKNFEGIVISNVGHTKETADGIIRSGAADMVAFGRAYMANPDLPERFQNNWPLAEVPAHEYWWAPEPGAKGYSDYPAYKASE